MNNPTRYIFVTGGVLSGIGKGITASAIGAVFKARGFSVSMQKCDPYLNVDAGTLNPAEHGECFVTRDGAETDLDLGHYERFLDVELTQKNATLAGQLLSKLIADERAGAFLGKTIQLVPHFTNAIQEAIVAASEDVDVHIVEIGGTVGDYESLAFFEAIREFSQARPGLCQFVHVVYVPFLRASKEFKTKPAQNAVRDLRQIGITPNVIVARTEEDGGEVTIPKISMFGGVPQENVVVLQNAKTIYQVPEQLEERGIGNLLVRQLGFEDRPADMSPWHDFTEKALTHHANTKHIGIVAKYLHNEDSYYSVIEALKIAAWQQSINLEYSWVDAEVLEQEGTESLRGFDGLLVPGGFGQRGVEGKIAAADFALTNNVPYLGICLGLQVAVIAAARRGGLQTATSSELQSDAEHPVIYIMKDQVGKEATGGTMRLGDYPCVLRKGSLAEKVYGTDAITERHRHRYEVNQVYTAQINAGGLEISGTSPDGTLVEMIEATNHPFFIATQAHPEFRARPFRPHPLFSAFLAAS